MSNIDDFKIGQVVRSKAGRDKGEWMVVIGTIKPDYLIVCNGINRKVSNPKKKNIKHIAKTNYISSLITNKLKNGVRVTNNDIRTVLEPYNKKIQSSE